VHLKDSEDEFWVLELPREEKIVKSQSCISIKPEVLFYTWVEKFQPVY
jgi:hypothetical protein